MEKNKQEQHEGSINVYDFNKYNIKQIKPLDETWVKQHCLEVAEEIMKTKNSHYWMLLCREIYDITMFNVLNENINAIEFKTILGEEIYECLKERGKIIDFVQREDNNYEIWIRDKASKENFVYYLFNYNLGVIDIKEVYNEKNNSKY